MALIPRNLNRVLFRAAATLSIATMYVASGQPAGRPTFEVASIKPHASEDMRTLSPPQFLPGGRFTSRGVPLKILISVAWNVGFMSMRLTGGPQWIMSREGNYDIEAKAPEGAIPPGLPGYAREEKMKLMLRALLEDRFKLKIRTETKELPIYAAVVGKGGSKLEMAGMEEKDCPENAAYGVACHTIMGGRGRGMHGNAVNMQDVLSTAENWCDRPLVDMTGIKGLFKIDTKGWRDFQPGPAPAAGVRAEDGSDMMDVPTLFEVFERLGLKLQPQKGNIDVYIIESVERPTEN